MSDSLGCTYSIEITDIESRGSHVSVTTPMGLQAHFYDGDTIRGSVIVEVANIYHIKYLGIDLVGCASASVQRIDSSATGPKSFKQKEVFLWKSMALAGTPPSDSPVTLSSSRPSLHSAAVTSQGRIVQLNRGRHVLPFELTLETGCTPGSVQWKNYSMPSQATHNVNAHLSYKLKVFCQPADSSKMVKVAKQFVLVGGFEHSRESLKAMVSKGSGKTKMGHLTFPLMDGQITYAATLDARAYHLGDTALLTLVVDNKLPHPVGGISVRFNNMISLLGGNGKAGGSSSNLSSSNLSSSSSSSTSSSENTFTESEVLTLMTERYTVKPNESVKRVISIVIPPTAFSTTKYTRTINLMAFLDITINVQSHTPSVSEKSFQVPIYVINKLPTRDVNLTPTTLSSSPLSTNVVLNSSSGLSISPESSASSPNSSFKDLQGVMHAFGSSLSASQSVTKAPGIVIWTNDNEVNQCTICAKDFTLLRRRHHCRSCGRVMCGKCGKEASVDPLFGIKPQKLCTPCLEELQHFLDDSRTSTEIDESSNTLTLSYTFDESISPRNKRSSIQLLSKSTSGGSIQSAVISNPITGTQAPLSSGSATGTGATTTSAPTSAPNSAVITETGTETHAEKEIPNMLVSQPSTDSSPTPNAIDDSTQTTEKFEAVQGTAKCNTATQTPGNPEQNLVDSSALVST